MDKKRVKLAKKNLRKKKTQRKLSSFLLTDEQQLLKLKYTIISCVKCYCRKYKSSRKFLIQIPKSIIPSFRFPIPRFYYLD